MSMTTLNLVPRLLKMLSHRDTCYHPLSQFIPYLPLKSNSNDNFKFSSQAPQYVITSYRILSPLITPYNTLGRVISTTILNLVHGLL